MISNDLSEVLFLLLAQTSESGLLTSRKKQVLENVSRKKYHHIKKKKIEEKLDNDLEITSLL